MKKIYSIIAALFITLSIFSQAPQKMSYQAVIRNSSDALVTSTPVGMRISIIQGSIFGPSVYVETQTTTTNANGLVSLEIGTGAVITGTFAGINWAAGPYFIKTETDPTGGTAYTISGTNELMSVPYALYAANGGTPGPAGPTGATGPAGPAGATGPAGPSLVGGFTHYIGENYLGGIIYYLYKGSDSLEHGLVLAPTESLGFSWQTSPTLVNADRTDDGAYNTARMIGSPAQVYITSLGSGWYLPSIDELGLLFYNRFLVQKGLRAIGYTQLSNYYEYWSSTEDIRTTDRAYIFHSFYENTTTKVKTLSSVVLTRGVRAF